MNLDEYDFEVPQKLIAQKPVSPRSASKLLNLEEGFIKDTNFVDIINSFKKEDLIVVNDSKVIPVKLEGITNNSEVLVTLFKKLRDNRWLAFAKPGRKCKINEKIFFSDLIYCKILNKNNYEVDIEFNCNEEILNEFINKKGLMPLPPYIKRENKNLDDYNSYQTIFAKNFGSIAAPTAGLHFDDEILNKIEEKGIKIVKVTLHVGLGTFLPIRNNIIENNVLHKERGCISDSVAKKINETKDNGGKIIAVGTTVLRLLEASCKVNGRLKSFDEETDIFIFPGFKFRIVDKLLTNFHLPRSSLFLLVSAFAGKNRIMRAYKHAINFEYRFYSYGDAMIISKNKNV